MALYFSIYLCRKFLIQHEWTAVPQSAHDEGTDIRQAVATALSTSISRTDVATGIILLALTVIILDLGAATVALFSGSALAMIGTIVPWMLLVSCALELLIVALVCLVRLVKRRRHLDTNDFNKLVEDTNDFNKLVESASDLTAASTTVSASPPVDSVSAAQGKL